MQAKCGIANVSSVVTQNFPIVEGNELYKIFGLTDTGSESIFINIEYHQYYAENHPELVSKFAYTKDMYGVSMSNISGVDVGKENKQGRGGWGVDFSTVITYKPPLMVNIQPMTASFDLGEGIARNAIFSSLFLQTIKY